ncbi:hypothetical protein L2E82_02537 [Cichorium intybus]|uniref:Uncharacterized protein n=1 Tax=Cichorium intybus TaxID=13427 RepID=A0ACB9H1W5_CICIN|nr:hypothetical protein L2E82_02537 [Cichorium intybus]
MFPHLSSDHPLLLSPSHISLTCFTLLEPSTNSEKFNINPSLSPPSFYQSKARLYQSIWRIPEDFLSHAAAVLNLRPPEIDS